MRTTMKLAALTLAAAAMVGSSAATASARSGGFDDLFEHGGSRQHNECSTSTGTTLDTSFGGPTGNLSFDTKCVNFDETGEAHQSNECSTASGFTGIFSGIAPAGKVDISAECANIASDPS